MDSPWRGAGPRLEAPDRSAAGRGCVFERTTNSGAPAPDATAGASAASPGRPTSARGAGADSPPSGTAGRADAIGEVDERDSISRLLGALTPRQRAADGKTTPASGAAGTTRAPLPSVTPKARQSPTTSARTQCSCFEITDSGTTRNCSSLGWASSRARPARTRGVLKCRGARLRGRSRRRSADRGCDDSRHQPAARSPAARGGDTIELLQQPAEPRPGPARTRAPGR